MLSILILCALLQSLQGASVPPPPHLAGSAATASVLGVEACDCPACPDDGGQQLRTVFSIVQSCLLTIFACVWKSIHPNIDGPRDSGWTRLKRRLVTMFCALIAPELVLLWALDQRGAGQKIAEEYNKEFARPLEKININIPTWRKLFGWIVDWFQLLPKDTTRRGRSQPWTTTHGFFIQMGGFLLYENEYPKEVLDFDRLKQLIQEGAIDAPTVTESDIQDRSKGDTISKAIVVLQALWFVVQCIARAIQRLPLSELEVLTLAFAVVNAAIYFAWWDKPQEVGQAICVPLKGTGKAAQDTTRLLMNEEATDLQQPEHRHSNNSLPDEDNHQSSWFRQTLQANRDQCYPPVFFIIFLPLLVLGSALRPMFKLFVTGEFSVKQLRMPMFYATKYEGSGTFFFFLLICIIFGAIHLLSWASDFPSHYDRVLWRISATILTAEPLILPFLTILYDLRSEGLMFCCTALLTLGMPLYVAARIILIVIALKAIHNPPLHVLLDITWTRYIPHF